MRAKTWSSSDVKKCSYRYVENETAAFKESIKISNNTTSSMTQPAMPHILGEITLKSCHDTSLVMKMLVLDGEIKCRS